MKKRRKRRPDPRRMLIGLLVLILLALGVRGLYQRLYSHRTHVATGTQTYRKQTDFQGILLYDQRVFDTEGAVLRDDAVNRRMGAHQPIGTAGRLPLPADRLAYGQADVLRWISQTINARVNPWAPVYLPGSDPENTYGKQPPDPALSAGPFRVEDGTLVLNRSAFVGRQPDEFSHRFRYANREKLHPDEVRPVLDAQPREAGDARFTLINDHVLAAVLFVNGEVPDAAGTSLRFFADGTEHTGDLVRTAPDDGETMLVLDLNGGFSFFYPRRRMEGELVFREFRALALPRSVWTTRNGQEGVLIRNDDAVVEFIPVDDAEIEADTIFVNIESTALRVYDEVFLHPDAVKEGDFIE